MRAVDLTGKRFGKWTVIEIFSKTTHGKLQWLCQCDCGTIRPVEGTQLRSGHSKSCRCLGEPTAQLRSALRSAEAKANSAQAKLATLRTQIEMDLEEITEDYECNCPPEWPRCLICRLKLRIRIALQRAQ